MNVRLSNTLKMLSIFVRSMSSLRVRTPISVYGIEGRYVAALYSAASQMKQLDETEKGLRSLLKELKKPKIVDFLSTSLMPRASKAKLLQEIGKEAGMPLAATNFLSVVARNGRLLILHRIIKMFLTVMVAHHNNELCEVITAEPLDDASRKALVEVLKKLVKPGKGIQLTEKVKEDIIGGLVVGFEDKHVDLSIARRVNLYSALLKD